MYERRPDRSVVQEQKETLTPNGAGRTVEVMPKIVSPPPVAPAELAQRRARLIAAVEARSQIRDAQDLAISALAGMRLTEVYEHPVLEQLKQSIAGLKRSLLLAGELIARLP